MNNRYPYAYPSRQPPTPVSTPVFLVGLATLFAAVGAGIADYENVPPIAPCLDALTSRIFQRFPALQRLPSDAWFATSGAEVGVLVLVVGLALAARFAGARPGNSRMERQLRTRTRQYKRAHRAGFNV
jgi:hypothetical protein